MNKIFYDENKNYKFDFTDVADVFEAHNLSQKNNYTSRC